MYNVLTNIFVLLMISEKVNYLKKKKLNEKCDERIKYGRYYE